MPVLQEQIMQTQPCTAFLSSCGEYSMFTIGEKTITFLTSRNLERYTEVVEWDEGYLVVMCRMKQHPDVLREDYIDLVPILENLYIDPISFLKPVKEVQIRYA